jgi:hypothetical protein
VLAACCPRRGGGGNGTGPSEDGGPGWCGPTGVRLLRPSDDYATDPCHTPPNVCTTDGHLLQLVLPAAGLDCNGSLPDALASFRSLKLLELSYNRIDAPAAQVAGVVARMPALEVSAGA